MATETLFHVIVNQKLAFARLEMQAADRAAQSGERGARLAEHAHLDSAVWQLNQALLFFTKEIAEQYDVLVEATDESIVHIGQGFQDQGVTSPEMNEILALLQAPDSWLAHLELLRQDPRQMAGHFKAHRQGASSDEPALIAAVDVTTPAGRETQTPAELVADYALRLQALIDRQRGALVEE